MKRNVFFSFHYERDNWRVNQIRQISALETQPIFSSNKWEEVKRGGDLAIQHWITTQMKGKSCVIVLVGSETASRRWVKYEITQGWNLKKGILLIRINKLRDITGLSSPEGPNPLANVHLKDSGKSLADIVQIKTPYGTKSTDVYSDIRNNIEFWIEEAIQIRSRY